MNNLDLHWQGYNTIKNKTLELTYYCMASRMSGLVRFHTFARFLLSLICGSAAGRFRPHVRTPLWPGDLTWGNEYVVSESLSRRLRRRMNHGKLFDMSRGRLEGLHRTRSPLTDFVVLRGPRI